MKLWKLIIEFIYFQIYFCVFQMTVHIEPVNTLSKAPDVSTADKDCFTAVLHTDSSTTGVLDYADRVVNETEVENTQDQVR